jgi:hypothetical protein
MAFPVLEMTCLRYSNYPWQRQNNRLRMSENIADSASVGKLYSFGRAIIPLIRRWHALYSLRNGVCAADSWP